MSYADLPLFIAPPPRKAARELTSEDRRRALFQKFHAANPHVYEHLVRMTRELVDAGHKRIGIRMLWEVLRWSEMRSNRPENAPKLNDWFPPFYARLIQRTEPGLAGVFEIRGTVSDIQEGTP